MYNYNNTSSYGNSCGNMNYTPNSNRPVFPENYMYAQSYVPWQQISNTFEPAKGLSCGTIFPELYTGYSPCQSIELIKYLELSSKGGCLK